MNYYKPPPNGENAYYDKQADVSMNYGQDYRGYTKMYNMYQDNYESNKWLATAV